MCSSYIHGQMYICLTMIIRGVLKALFLVESASIAPKFFFLRGFYMPRRFRFSFTDESTKGLNDQATLLLRGAGYTWSGRSKEDVNVGQVLFEKRMLCVAMQGRSRKRV